MRMYLLITPADLNQPKLFSRLAKAKSWAFSHYPFAREGWRKVEKSFPQESPKWIPNNYKGRAEIRSVPVEDVK